MPREVGVDGEGAAAPRDGPRRQTRAGQPQHDVRPLGLERLEQRQLADHLQPPVHQVHGRRERVVAGAPARRSAGRGLCHAVLHWRGRPSRECSPGRGASRPRVKSTPPRADGTLCGCDVSGQAGGRRAATATCRPRRRARSSAVAAWPQAAARPRMRVRSDHDAGERDCVVAGLGRAGHRGEPGSDRRPLRRRQPPSRRSTSRPRSIRCASTSAATRWPACPASCFAQLTARRTGSLKVRTDYVRSRRASPSATRWTGRRISRQQMSAGHPDVGVFMIGANDTGMPMIAEGEFTMYPKKAWLDEYERRAKKLDAIMLQRRREARVLGRPAGHAQQRPRRSKVQRPQRALRGRRRQQPGRRLRGHLRPAGHEERRLQRRRCAAATASTSPTKAPGASPRPCGRR